MKAISAVTTEMDSFRAGVELADVLAPIDPDIVFLFTSVDHQNPKEISEAIYDVLGKENILLIGCSGDGFLETTTVADVGACALGIHLGEGVRTALSFRCRGNFDSKELLARSLDDLKKSLGQKPDLCFVLCDYSQDGSAMEDVFQQERVAAVGGFAADDMLDMNTCILYANRDVLRDGIVTLGLAGDFRMAIHVTNQLDPIGKCGRVTEARGTWLGRIEDMSAVAFIEEAISRPISRVDQGIVTLNVLDADIPGKRYVRSIVSNSQDRQGGLHLFGGIRSGARIQVCISQPEAIVKEVYRLAEVSATADFTPSAGLIVSCAGRKHLLGNRIGHEVQAVRERLPRTTAFAGFTSFGEFGPLRHADGRYTATFFHNMTYILLLFGD